MKKNTLDNLKFFLYSTAGIIPTLSFAALDGLRTLIRDFGGLVDLTRPIVFGLALLFFFWGMAQFILNAGDAKLREDGKQRMIWSVIAMFVLISIFGIVYFIGTLTGIPTGCFTGGTGTVVC